ncbi:iron-containing alcohol dehydrogenase [Acidovorax sp. HDW3]|uniref:iron-containing alcohol dehydrogenase n=1 Tax=Acidovorax sp. HDW3 TaxID=2714923 RepID=UPI00140D1502|nr:iron-containing alcohol dehydrogenase [Acidovorax sp. HDW3]QIL42955.1 iron-containing alcohol dehydrogenase [Acidovorax sp. HDW3]
MRNFDFYNPTRIVFGQGRMAEIDRLVPAAARVLILVGGASAEKHGTLAAVRQALGARVHATFAGIEPNPHYETALQAVAQIRAGGFDYLLALGGGSVIDAAKFIAAAALYDGAEPWELVRQRGRSITRALPLGAVLTLPATGSEMNDGGVLTHHARGHKLSFSSPHCFPQWSLLDPSLTYTLPPRQLANGVVDAFVHTTEQYLTYPVGGGLQDRFAEGLLLELIDIGPRILAAPAQPDYADRANLMWAASWALNGLIGAGVPQDWATHVIGHEFTALYGIDHGRSLALVLPALLHERRAPKRAKLLQYAQRVWGLTAGDEEARIDAAIARTRDFFEGLGVPTRLSAYGLGAEAVDAVVANLQAHGMVQLGEQREITPEVVRRILLAAL